ncbi:hypothetical protein C8Q76DRAFT_766264 [Earliella scabrosa]|nr:hypothetical protein C8Q76DRAFT_766264 [Earliella scabrosa]
MISQRRLSDVAITSTPSVVAYRSVEGNRIQPKLANYYDATLVKLCQEDSSLERLWADSVFACATFNVGPHTVTERHFDHLNLAYGGCAITSIGNFNPTTGGHIVLWELMMIIEFPPMSTVIIPSAIVSHSNVDIGADERRQSFTQYSPGGLFRWVDCGFQSKTALEAQGLELGESGADYWTRGIGMLTTYNELEHARRSGDN